MELTVGQRIGTDEGPLIDPSHRPDCAHLGGMLGPQIIYMVSLSPGDVFLFSLVHGAELSMHQPPVAAR